jgi:selenocysteine lyase/cysteine desulfurase
MTKAPLDCGRPLDILEVKCRTSDGTPRPAALVDAEVEEAVIRAAQAGRRVLLTLVDVSKTGLLAPTPVCVDSLRRRFPDLIEVLVDACQFRLAPSTLRAYLEHDFLVAITGSKFVTGPTFCGALLVPKGPAQRLKNQPLPHALKSYSARADWPRNWTARVALKNVTNYGLLLRWEAALTELRAFRELPEAAIADFLKSFAVAVERHLSRTPVFEALPVPALNRGPVTSTESWDHVPTIFSFLLARRAESEKPIWLNRDETKRIHRRLLSSRCQIGQPVACGTRAGIPVSALRLCASTRLIVDALSPQGRGQEAVIAEALAVLDKVAVLVALSLI